MVPFIARAILWFIVAFILFDTIKEFNKLFNHSLNPYFAIVPAVLNYLLQEYMIRRDRVNQKAPMNRIDKTLCFVGWIIVGSLFLCVLIVWVLVICKASIKGGL